jgi:hypothetical protein
MKISETFSGSYFKAADFPTPRTFVIESISEVKFEEGSKPVVRLQGERQQLALNKTNGFVLASVFGDDTESWTGHQIQVSAVPTLYQGRPVNGLKVQPLTPPGNLSGQIASATPATPAARQLPPSLTPPPQLLTPQVQAPRVDYDA